MFSIQLSQVITNLFESPMCRFPAEESHDHGILLEMDLEVHERYDKEDSRNPSVRETCYFLMRRASNYVNIWWCLPEDRFAQPVAWKNTSNHDSCWRDDGVRAPITELYFKMCNEVNHAEAPVNLENFLWKFDVKKVRFEGLRQYERENGTLGYVFDSIRPV